MGRLRIVFPYFSVPYLFLALGGSSPAYAGDRCDGAAIIKLLGTRAELTYAPESGRIGALVKLPANTSASQLGLDPVMPGVGRLRATTGELLAFADAHPDLYMEVAPPLKPLMDQSSAIIRAGVARSEKGVDGTNVLIGVADTGVDVGHPDLLDENGKTRVAWLLDLSRPPVGKYPELEQRFGIKDSAGQVSAGAVFSGDDIDTLRAEKKDVPGDEVGHGTHVVSIAAGNGGADKRFVGVAPKSKIIFARVTRAQSSSIENDDLLRGTDFMFERATAMNQPIVVNLSVGTDFGPHDGSLLWEQTLANYIGPDKPGRAMVVAAGNSGSIVESAVHQSVHVTKGSRTAVAITTSGARSGSVQVWVATRRGSKLSIGLDAPEGVWLTPVPEGSARQRESANNTKAVIVHGSSVAKSPVPAGSRGAVVTWSGSWKSGIYSIILTGEGSADLFMQSTGDAQGAGFVAGVREGTINLPAVHPSIIAVGCTVNKPSWTSISEANPKLSAPLLDAAGSLPAHRRSVLLGESRALNEGEMCWFSSAGPSVTGVPKPEISAPGAALVGAMSGQAAPGTSASIFSSSSCPLDSRGNRDKRCLQVDATHAVSVGTSMSAPHVAGAVALLFQQDPTLTQDKLIPLLQAGAHPFRANITFDDQSGAGELDVWGALDALEQSKDNVMYLPDRNASWLTLSNSFAVADGSLTLTAILELRTTNGLKRADYFDSSRLRPSASINNKPITPEPTLVRRAPGLWFFTIDVPPGNGGSKLAVGATFDGIDIVPTKTIPIATDTWNADYGSYSRGGCSISSPRTALLSCLTVPLIWLVRCGRTRRRFRG